ncbi:hypothetical protein LXA43DRAFT_894490 [Ganoderma leucocontextum]|nr:hypothetical protein LXA43DRAFT_894490 [Ganoderma leucocontextum]
MTPSTSPTGSPRDGSVDHSSPPSQQPAERPERSRNAKAQARHRAKRKAYIERLEQTVTKLQSVLALSPDQVAAIPPPLTRIRELQQENELLCQEVEELRRQLRMENTRCRPDFRRDTYTPLPYDRHFNRESMRYRTADAVGGGYVVRCSARTGCRPSHAALHRHPPPTTTHHFHLSPFHPLRANTPPKAHTPRPTRHTTRHDRWAATTRMVCRDIPCRR